ncbi:MAG: bifunctional 4-hydroxy-2-oxoglutarate aldolase/2-dehydro-3-deoxy-phosphogluconate aldolase [Nitrososphaerota archaeon]|nr:bifunctional 4-hydroxy-2-oxoglutarate aldolase/2-dehydro-3-deoxy-phosphogluconate aldolase [Candidatus Geocrenenecus dongiae]
MGLYEKHEVVAKVIEIGLVPIFYHGDVEVAKNVSIAVTEAGSKLLEFTNRGPRAFMVFAELAKWRDSEKPDLILGAGTILDPATAALYINLGADFIVGPSFNPEVAKICNRRHVPYIPGCSTPTEIAYAEELGADIFKVFPAEVLSPKFIKNLLGPCPWLKLMPSGGLEPKKEMIKEWIEAGAVALNMGTSLLKPDLIKAGDYESLKKLVQECLQYIREAKAEAKAKKK